MIAHLCQYKLDEQQYLEESSVSFLVVAADSTAL